MVKSPAWQRTSCALLLASFAAAGCSHSCPSTRRTTTTSPVLPIGDRTAARALWTGAPGAALPTDSGPRLRALRSLCAEVIARYGTT